MPINGHTPTVRLLGSDEANTIQRESWRRMPAEFRAGKQSWLFSRSDRQLNAILRRNYRDILLIGLRFCQRLICWSGSFVRRDAAGLISAAIHLARLWTRRVRDEARHSGQPDSRAQKRQSDHDTYGDLAYHCLVDSIKRAAGRMFATLYGQSAMCQRVTRFRFAHLKVYRVTEQQSQRWHDLELPLQST